MNRPSLWVKVLLWMSELWKCCWDWGQGEQQIHLLIQRSYFAGTFQQSSWAVKGETRNKLFNFHCDEECKALTKWFCRWQQHMVFWKKAEWGDRCSFQFFGGTAPILGFESITDMYWSLLRREWFFALFVWIFPCEVEVFPKLSFSSSFVVEMNEVRSLRVITSKEEAWARSWPRRFRATMKTVYWVVDCDQQRLILNPEAPDGMMLYEDY